MIISSSQLKTAIVYPDTDGAPMAESDPARDYLIYSVEALKLYFQKREDVYVSGNLFIYYQEGVPSAVIAPDVFVVFGVANKQRMSYKVWQENNKIPAFVLEVTSKTTQVQDEQDKPIKYARIGVKEYFQYDPTGDYLPSRLKGSQLLEGQYQSIESRVLPDGSFSIHSEVLGLDLRLIDEKLRFFEPQTNKKLLSYQELEEARIQAESAKQQAEQARQDAVSRLAEMGIEVEQIATALSLSVEVVREILAANN